MYFFFKPVSEKDVQVKIIKLIKRKKFDLFVCVDFWGNCQATCQQPQFASCQLYTDAHEVGLIFFFSDMFLFLFKFKHISYDLWVGQRLKFWYICPLSIKNKSHCHNNFSREKYIFSFIEHVFYPSVCLITRCTSVANVESLTCSFLKLEIAVLQKLQNLETNCSTNTSSSTPPEDQRGHGHFQHKWLQTAVNAKTNEDGSSWRTAEYCLRPDKFSTGLWCHDHCWTASSSKCHDNSTRQQCSHPGCFEFEF